MSESPSGDWLHQLMAGLERQGPGCPAATRQAWQQLRPLRPRPTIVELGCGSGGATLELARLSAARLVALDRALGPLAELRRRAAAATGSAAIELVAGDLCDPPLADGAADLVWAEGALYLAGFDAGLARWRRLLAPGGQLAFTELSWVHDDPPATAVAFWQQAYPDLRHRLENRRRIEAAGFQWRTDFVLPREAWWDHYYEPLSRRLTAFRQHHAERPQALAMADSIAEEIALWQQAGESYNYVFYLASVAEA